MNRGCWILACLFGCGSQGPQTALQIEMVPNAAFNSRQEVRDALEALDIVVDGTVRALRGLPAEPGPVGERARAENRDPDADLELVFALDLVSYSDLPIVQLEPGSNGDQALLFRLYGLDGADAIAATGQVVVAFQPDEVVRAQAPFNLRAEYRPPRVIAIQPDPDLTEVVCDASFAVIFSEAMDPVSVAAAFALRTPEGPLAGDFTMADGSTRLEFDPAEPLGPGAYSLEVSSGALDEQGEALDQDPFADGGQPYARRFTAACP